MDRDSFVIYKSYLTAGQYISNKSDRVDYYEAIFNYGFDGKEPKLKPNLRAMFELIKPQIDANNKRYENGKKGGRPKRPKDMSPEEREQHLNECVEQALNGIKKP